MGGYTPSRTPPDGNQAGGASGVATTADVAVRLRAPVKGSMAGAPLKNLFPNGLCQAKNRRGEPCGVRLGVRRCKNGRLLCKWHAGYSTGPRTPEGKARCGEAGRRNLREWHALRKRPTGR